MRAGHFQTRDPIEAQRVEEELAQRAVALAPAQLDSYVRSPPRWIRSEDYDHELAGLRKAGWREE
jgi:hypothetical protein